MLFPFDHRTQESNADGNVPRPNGILVIEDQRLLRNALKEGFQQRGFRVWVAADGSEGVALYRQFWPQIDIVLSDVQMPVLDGPATLDALREINPSVRFCFMTGDTRTVVQARLLRRGVLRVFEKPLPSVAAVAQELWELATSPYCLIAEPDLGHTEAKDPSHSVPSTPSQQIPVDRFFPTLLRSIAGLSLFLGKPQ